MIRALCVGHICYDIILPVSTFPVENEKYVISESRESSGGPACNAASLLGLWKIKTAFAGLVGHDIYGERAAAELAAAGVDTGLLERRQGQRTPLSLIIVNTGTGSRTILNRKSPTGNLQYSASDYPDAPLELLLFDGHELAASLSAMEAFPEAVTVLDAGSRRAGTEELSRRVDYCVASERFASEMTGLAPTPQRGCDLHRSLLALLARGARNAAITLGERGCVFMPAADPVAPTGPQLRSYRLSAFTSPDAPAVDTTAAGDIFHGAFAAGLLDGRDFAGALRLATVAAGLSVRRTGGRESIPQLSDVRESEESWLPRCVEIHTDNSEK